MNHRRRMEIAEKLRVALQTKNAAERRSGFTRAATVEIFKTECSQLIDKHGAELLELMEAVSEEESTEPDDGPKVFADIESLRSEFNEASDAHSALNTSPKALANFERSAGVFFAANMNIIRDWLAGKKIVALNSDGSVSDTKLGG